MPQEGKSSKRVHVSVACPGTMQMIRSFVVEQDSTLSDRYALRLKLDLLMPPASDHSRSSGCGPRRVSGATHLGTMNSSDQRLSNGASQHHVVSQIGGRQQLPSCYRRAHRALCCLIDGTWQVAVGAPLVSKQAKK